MNHGSKMMGVVLLLGCACTANGSDMKDEASAQEAVPSPMPAQEPSAAPSPVAPPGPSGAGVAPSTASQEPQAGSKPTADAPGSSLRASPTGGVGRPDRKGAGQPERGAAGAPSPNEAKGAAPAGGETGRSDSTPR